jgi:hypothetical protein
MYLIIFGNFFIKYPYIYIRISTLSIHIHKCAYVYTYVYIYMYPYYQHAQLIFNILEFHKMVSRSPNVSYDSRVSSGSSFSYENLMKEVSDMRDYSQLLA